MVWNAAHWLACAACEGEIEKCRDFQGVFKKHFIEIAEPEKKNLPLMLALDFAILFHHGAIISLTAKIGVKSFLRHIIFKLTVNCNGQA
jgi:hypothetical protein